MAEHDCECPELAPGSPSAGESRVGERDDARGASAIADGLPPDDVAFLRTTGLVRLAAAARWLGVSPASLRRHVHEGRCSGRKFDGDWFIGRGTVDDWFIGRGTVERWRLRRALHLR